MARFFDDVKVIYQGARASLEKKEKVEINLYFGADGDRKELAAKFPELKDGPGEYRFSKWKMK